MTTTAPNTPYFDAALSYARRRWRVLPVLGKKPASGNGWQHQASCDPNQVKSLFRVRHDAVGVLLGKASGIIDIECDDTEAEERLLELFDGEIPRTPTFQSTRGRHLLFRWSPKVPVHDKSVFKLGQLEFRTGNGKGAQSVFPPSGNRVWIVSPEDCEPADLPDSVIKRIESRIQRRESENRPTPGSHSGDQDTRMKRARSYLAKVPGAVSGQRGHDATFGAACKLIGFGIHRDEAFELIADWNRICEPPWTDSELWHKIDEAIKADPQPMPDRPRTVRSSGNRIPKDGVDPDNDDSWTDITTDRGRTELSNARRFVAEHGDNVRFCHAWQKWLCWDGTRWKIDDDGAVQRRAAEVADALWREVVANHSKDCVEFAVKTSRQSGINAMLNLASSMKSVRVEQLDANQWLLNCPNGTVDLRTGKLRPNRREDNLTKLCPTRYNPDATAISFSQFLEGVFEGNATLILFLQRLFGYCLTGDISEQCLPVFHGVGANGKSTLLTAIQETLGNDYSMTAPPSLLMEKKTDAHPTELASLFGRRLVVAAETNQGARLAESTVKQLTGGDRISARRMREDFWEFAPTHKIVLCTNHKPRIKGNDHAIWRRLHLVPFSRTFWNPAKGETGPEELRQDKTLPAKLKAEAEGILACIVDGCLAWQRDGLQVPDIVRAATSEYRNESDTVGRFVAECCVRMPQVRVKFSDLYTALEKWCEDAGESLPSKRFVGQWLKDGGFREHANNGRWYIGIAVKVEDPRATE